MKSWSWNHNHEIIIMKSWSWNHNYDHEITIMKSQLWSWNHNREIPIMKSQFSSFKKFSKFFEILKIFRKFFMIVILWSWFHDCGFTRNFQKFSNLFSWLWFHDCHVFDFIGLRWRSQLNAINWLNLFSWQYLCGNGR